MKGKAIAFKKQVRGFSRRSFKASSFPETRAADGALLAGGTSTVMFYADWNL
jgi:hypothetical protein